MGRVFKELGGAMVFYIATLSFIAGIGLRSFVSFEAFYLYLGILGIFCAWFFVRRTIITYSAVAIFFLFLGFLRLSALDEKAGEKYRAQYMGKAVTFEGTILDEPELREEKVKYTLSRIVLSESHEQLSGKVLVTSRLYPRYAFLDRLRLRCRLEKPKPFNGFAYDSYLAKDGIYALCYYPSAVLVTDAVVEYSFADQFKKYIFLAKNNFIVHLGRILPAPHAGLLAGLLVGETSGIPEYLKQAFTSTGTIHIVAISGFNIMIIVSILLKTAPYFYIPRRLAWAMIVPALIIFVIMTGAEASVVRAALMALIVGCAAEGGRFGDVKRVLLITAFIMLISNPYLLRFDVGFQLSFLATIGLVYIAPWLDELVQHHVQSLVRAEFIRVIPSKVKAFLNALRESATITVGANLAVAPLLLWTFGRVSLISPLVNILILWVIPATMAIGFFAVIVSYIFLPAATLLGFGSWLLLEYIIEVVEFF